MILRTSIALFTLLAASLTWSSSLLAAPNLDLVITGNTLGYVRPCED